LLSLEIKPLKALSIALRRSVVVRTLSALFFYSKTESPPTASSEIIVVEIESSTSVYPLLKRLLKHFLSQCSIDLSFPRKNETPKMLLYTKMN
jgi:hypothetical protein